MNKAFKTLWNDVRQAYIVTNEAQKSHGKPAKTAIAIALISSVFLAGSASAAYVEPGVQGNTIKIMVWL